MFRRASGTIVCTVFIVLSHGSIRAQNLAIEDVTDRLTPDPERAPLVIDDIENFVRAHRLLTSDADTLRILRDEYLDRGSPGLKMFIEKYALTAERLRDAIRNHPDRYESLDEMPRAILATENEVRRAFRRFKEVIPRTLFPPTYFLVGAFRGIGSGSTEGQLITVEKWSIPIEDETPMIIHELTHFQQVLAVGYEKYKALFDEEKSLLGLCIREGTAEFVADRVTGAMTQDEALEYTVEHEAELWLSFAEEMHEPETGDWMWSKPKNPEQPRHVGYVLGAFIVGAYYANAADEAQAVRDILGVTDYAEFLEQSGYAARFQARRDAHAR